MKKIFVLGSIFIDHSISTKVLPSFGITVKGEKYNIAIGGKGINQAVAISRLGGDVKLTCAVGKDNYGKQVKELCQSLNLKANIIDTNEQTGVAFITINANDGTNQIVTVPGANLAIENSNLDSLINEIDSDSIFISQLETKLDSIFYIIKEAKKKNATIILNPSPYAEIPNDVMSCIDFLVPNEFELDMLTSGEKCTVLAEKAQNLLIKGAKNVLVTLGENGSILFNKDEQIKVNAIKTNVVDTTGAGDCYLGSFAYSIALGKSFKESMEFASRCAAIEIGKIGTVDAMPSQDDLL